MGNLAVHLGTLGLKNGIEFGANRLIIDVSLGFALNNQHPSTSTPGLTPNMFHPGMVEFPRL